MEAAAADLSEPYEGENDQKIMEPTPDNIKMESIIKDIRVLLNTYNDPKEHVDDYLKKVEKTIEDSGMESEYVIDRNKIKKYIEKHPYFKNPCNYHIRLLTIMKYLKKKGIDINIKDIDLVVDEIIQEIDGVKKVGTGKYVKALKG